MKAMLLAAGRGQRLRPLTAHTPKPLLRVGDKPLIGHHLAALARAGIRDVVINAAWRAGDIQAALGDGRAYGLRIRYSVEMPGGLETGGGVRAALPLLGDAPFLLISADVFTAFDYAALCAQPLPDAGVRVVLTANPPHHPQGDFGLEGERLTDTAPRYTYAGIGMYAPQLFAGTVGARFGLASVIRAAMAGDRARGLYHPGPWLDVGRPATLARARAMAGQAVS